MIRRQPSIRRRVIAVFFALSVVAAVLYGWLLNYYLEHGLATDTVFEMEVSAVEFIEAYKKDPHQPPPRWPRFLMSVGEDGLPPRVRAVLPPAAQPLKTLVFSPEFPDKPECKEGDIFVMMVHPLPDGRRLYTLRTYPSEYFDLLPAWTRPQLLFGAIVPIGVGVVALSVLTVFLVVRNKRDSHRTLLRWAEGLSPERLDDPIPRFRFEEEQYVAELLHATLRRAQQSLEHEQRFLKNASHELRTPVTTLRTNADLLLRRVEAGNPARPAADRIHRTATGMTRLIETLLWLNTSDRRIPDPEPVDLDAMLAALIEENRYLLAGKQVDLQVELDAGTLELVPHAARIALGNLVRNAFQYADDGALWIRAEAGGVDIKNRASDPDPKATEDFGSGLGLELVEQICARSGWAYHSAFEGDGYHASVQLTPDPPQI